MRGTVYKKGLPSGTVVWQLQVDAGRDEHGKRLRISRSFRRKGDADDELSRLLQGRQDGSLVKPSPKTLRELISEWLREDVDKRCSPKTAERYRELLAYALPRLGDVPLRDLTTLLLERFYNRLHESGGKGGRSLSAKTVKHVHDTLRCALNSALRWKFLTINPAKACRLPKVKKTDARVLEKAEIEWVLDAVLGHPWLHALLVVASATGCRRGELLALTWLDINFTSGMMSVSKSLEQTASGLRIKSTKSEHSRRIKIPTTAIEALKGHCKAQQQLREAFGDDYRRDLDLVFATPEGEYLKPASVTAKVCLVAQQCGLKGVGLHSLRHTHGSQLLAAGVSLPAVSKRLGHSSVNTTAKVYAHVFAADEANAAQAWETNFGEAHQRSKDPSKNLVAAHGSTRRVQ